MTMSRLRRKFDEGQPSSRGLESFFAGCNAPVHLCSNFKAVSSSMKGSSARESSQWGGKGSRKVVLSALGDRGCSAITRFTSHRTLDEAVAQNSLRAGTRNRFLCASSSPKLRD